MSAEQPILDLCSCCGQKTESDVTCARCGTSLRVDLLLDGPVADDRLRFLAARDLMALKLPGATMAGLRRSLAAPEGLLVAGLSRSQARAALEVLARHDLRAAFRPTRAERGGRGRLPMLAVGALVVVLVLAGLALWARQGEPRTPPEALPAVATSDQGGAGRQAPAASTSQAGQASPAATGEGNAQRLSTQELARRVVPSIAEVSCQGRLGTAFFVTPDRAVSNAHVVCQNDQNIRVRLKDGRELVARPVTWEKALDVAVIEVVGAGVTPLPLGDSTVLAPGDRVVLVGNPLGLDFTVHEARVSYVGRNVRGVAYVQVDGNVNPGNSGGPLLNDRGEVVGIVTLKVTGADGIGLALPIEYSLPYLTGVARAGSSARWDEIVQRVRAEDRAEIEGYRARYQRPELVSVVTGGSTGLAGIFLHRRPERPGRHRGTLDLRVDEKTVCSTEATVDDWERLEQGLEKALRDSPDQPRLAWAVENHVMQDVYVGAAPLDLRGCKLDDLPTTAVVVARGAGDPTSPVHLPRFGAAAVQLADNAQRAQEFHQKNREAQAEASWRGAFRRVRSAMTTLEAKRDALKGEVARSLPTSDPKDPRVQLAQVEAELRSLKEKHDELDRQASLAGVPRHWRE